MLAALLLILQAAPGAERVAAGLSDTTADQYGPTLTADGRTMYFTLRADREGHEDIVMARFDGRGWSKPVMTRFSGAGLDKEPYLSPDGSMLFFASRRDYPSKLPAQGEESYDLFVVVRHGADWGAPEPLTGANSAAYDNYPAVAANGTVYFASHRVGGKGGNDLWRSPRVAGAWQTAENLTELNTSATDADPFVAPDESYVILSSSRPGGAGEGDLYVSFQREGHWTEPVTLGASVNTSTYEYTPWVTSDRKWLYFSRGWGEIWRIEVAAVPALRGIGASPKNNSNTMRR